MARPRPSESQFTQPATSSELCSRLEQIFTSVLEIDQAQEFSFIIGSDSVHCSCLGRDLASILKQPLSHLGAAIIGEPLVSIRVIDASCYLDFSPRELVSGFHLLQQRITELSDSEIYTSYDLDSEILSVVNLAERKAYLLVTSVETLKAHTRAAPFVAILHLFLRSKGVSLLHAAAIAFEDKAALLVGKGGSGKSTTALQCLANGFDYLADDYSAVSLGQEARVFSMYSSAKVHPDNLHRVSDLDIEVPASAIESNEKIVFTLHDKFPKQMLQSARLAAIVLPVVGATGLATIERVSAVTAMTALAPSSIFQLPEPGAHSFKLMTSLVRQIPAFRLNLCESARDNVEALQQLLVSL